MIDVHQTISNPITQDPLIVEMNTAQLAQVEALVSKVVKYSEENPVRVGVSVAAVLASAFILRKPRMKRDGNDYDSQITGGMKILNNEDHTLKGSEFHSSINDYEGKILVRG